MSQTISQYHALFMPTQTENFGHIIAETFQNARLVIISDQTPWRFLEHNKVGFDLPLVNKNQFIQAVIALSQLGQDEFNRMSRACLIYIQQKLNIEQIKKQYLKMFEL